MDYAGKANELMDKARKKLAVRSRPAAPRPGPPFIPMVPRERANRFTPRPFDPGPAVRTYPTHPPLFVYPTQTSSFMSMFSSTSKYEEAAELLEKACNNYKLAKMWAEAASGFELLADCHLKSDARHDAASAFVEAANAHKKISPDAAVRCLQIAVDHFVDMGRLSVAAKHLKDVADVREKEDRFADARDAYARAAELYDGEGNASTANSCKLKCAELAGVLEEYQSAIDLFEEVAKAAAGNNLLKFSCKGYLLNAGICRLCHQEPAGTTNAIERYEDVDPSFKGSREAKLLAQLANAAEEGDQDAFSAALAEYDGMSRLDPWKTKLLLRAKKKIQSRVEEEEDDLT